MLIVIPPGIKFDSTHNALKRIEHFIRAYDGKSAIVDRLGASGIN